MKEKQKRIATIQDISCFGKCSLTVALPVISAMGVECAVIPTAILSTHTGGFSGFTFRDLTDDIMPIAEHWKKSGISFDMLYTGYLGSNQQIELVKEFYSLLKNPATKLIVDPVMADNGKLYKGFSEGYAQEMTKLCAAADISVPNMTEAAFMLGRDYEPGCHTKEYIRDELKALCDLGTETTVLTGVRYNEGEIGVAAYNRTTGELTEYFREELPASYHGTGDIFSSCLAASLVKGDDMYSALKLAVDFTVECISATLEDKEHWYGVRFEDCIGRLTAK